MTYYQPLILVFLLLIATGLIRMRKSSGVWVPTLGLAGLFLLSWPLADWVFSRPLEARYPVRPFSGDSAQAIVVLSEGVDPPHFETPYALPQHGTYARCKLAAWLYTHWRPLPILASGGPVEPGTPPFSEAMHELLREEGVPENDIWTEDRSRSTHENAVYSSQLLRQKGVTRIVLVTDAKSMLRAQLCFQKERLSVLPAPSEFTQFGPLDEELIPSWKAIYRNELTLHETVGLAWYRLRGWI